MAHNPDQVCAPVRSLLLSLGHGQKDIVIPEDPAGYGPDTDILARRFSQSYYGRLDLSYLRITSIPELPYGLRVLSCHNTDITSLPKLPGTLKELNCRDNKNLRCLPDLPDLLMYLECHNNPKLTSLPKLPRWLRYLSVNNTGLESLPDLPEYLSHVYCDSTKLTEIPSIPENVWVFSLVNCPNLSIQREPGESLQDYTERWNEYREDQSRMRCQDRNAVVKEDLIATFWHPSRVEKMLEQGGWELVDSY